MITVVDTPEVQDLRQRYAAALKTIENLNSTILHLRRKLRDLEAK